MREDGDVERDEKGADQTKTASDVAPTDYGAEMQMCALAGRPRSRNVALMQLC